MPKVTLRKALIKKNQLAGEISELQNLIRSKNSYEVGESSVLDTNPLLEKYITLKNKMVLLKSSIQNANSGSKAKPDETLYFLVNSASELKDLISMLKSLNTKSGTFQESSYGQPSTKRTFECHISEGSVREKVAQLSSALNTILEGIDDFNSSTKVTIPEGV